MIIYLTTALIFSLFVIAVLVDKYSPVIQFHFIVGLGLLYLYDATEKEEGTQVIHQFMFGVCLVSISYIKPYDK